MKYFLKEKTLCFSVFVWSCLLHDQSRERSQTLQKSNPKRLTNRWKIVPKLTPKSIFFWTSFGDALRPRFWAGFGVHLGSMLGPFWGQKPVWKRLEKSSKKWLKKSHARRPAPRVKLACGPLKETSQTGYPQTCSASETLHWCPEGTVADLEMKFMLINPEIVPS